MSYEITLACVFGLVLVVFIERMKKPALFKTGLEFEAGWRRPWKVFRQAKNVNRRDRH